MLEGSRGQTDRSEAGEAIISAPIVYTCSRTRIPHQSTTERTYMHLATVSSIEYVILPGETSHHIGRTLLYGGGIEYCFTQEIGVRFFTCPPACPALSTFYCTLRISPSTNLPPSRKLYITLMLISSPLPPQTPSKTYLGMIPIMSSQNLPPINLILVPPYPTLILTSIPNPTYPTISLTSIPSPLLYIVSPPSTLSITSHSPNSTSNLKYI